MIYLDKSSCPDSWPDQLSEWENRSDRHQILHDCHQQHHCVPHCLGLLWHVWQPAAVFTGCGQFQEHYAGGAGCGLRGQCHVPRHSGGENPEWSDTIRLPGDQWRYVTKRLGPTNEYQRLVLWASVLPGCWYLHEHKTFCQPVPSISTSVYTRIIRVTEYLCCSGTSGDVHLKLCCIQSYEVYES